MKNHVNRKALIISLAMTGILAFSACAPATPPAPTPLPTQDISMVQTQAAQTVVADVTKNAPVPVTAPTATPVPTQAPPPGPTLDPNIPVAVFPLPAAGEPAAIAKFNSPIYSGPGANYVVYASFLGGKTAKVVGKSQDGQWWAISVPVAPAGSGWVNSSWVTVSNTNSVPVLPTPPAPQTLELVSPGPSDPQAASLVNVYVRSGPATNYPAYGIATTGTTARVIGKSEDGQWWVVRLNPEKVGAGYGWVMTQYTMASNVSGVQTIQNPIPPATIPPASPPSGSPVAMAVDYLNVREGPGTNYATLGVASPGSTAEVSGKSSDGSWWQVKIPTQFSSNGLGWVSAGYVITQSTDNVPVVSAPAVTPPVQATPPPLNNNACKLVSQSPLDNTVFAPGTSYSTTWVLKNTGTVKWDMNEVDVRYKTAVDNIPLHEGADNYDLTISVQPGDTYNFTVPMIAPFDPGTYGELWGLTLGSVGSDAVCEFYTYIQVK